MPRAHRPPPHLPRLSTAQPSAISPAPTSTGHTHTGTHISTSNAPSPISTPASSPAGARPDPQHGPTFTRGYAGRGGQRPVCGGYLPGGRAQSSGGLPQPGLHPPAAQRRPSAHPGTHTHSQRGAHLCPAGSRAQTHGSRQSRS